MTNGSQETTKQQHQKNNHYSSTLAVLVGIGIATGFINFTPMQSGKPSLAKDKKCFEDLKRKNSPQELMEIMKKKKMTESYCDLL